MLVTRHPLRIGVGFLAVLGALALPAIAQAHHNPPIDFQAATAATTPVIDGVIGDGEWTDAPRYDVSFPGVSGTVRFKHDAQFLYAEMTVSDASGGSKEMGAFFDDNHDGIKDPGDDVMLSFASPLSFGADYYYSSAGTSGATHYADTSTDGTNPPGNGTDNVLGAGQVVGSQVTFESRHPLCSDDTAHDFCLAPGDTVGIDLMYVLSGTGFMYPGADVFNPGDWADLTISAAPAPAGHIVFESNRDGNLEIYRMNADGTAPTRLTNNPANDHGPAISPDGTKVAFSSDRAGTDDIYVMNIDGSNLTRLTTDPGLEEQPAWSPDGTKIAYSGSVIEQSDIFVVDATGGTPVDVTNSAANEAGPSWSPDGTQLVFDSDRDGNREIYRANSDGSGTATRLTDNPALDSDPDWSPDGTKIAFYSDRPGSSCCGSVWTINASDGSGATNLTNGSIFDADPAWSPDGTHIAFVRDAGGQNFNVWTALADGSAQANLTTIGGRNSFPDWAPTPTGPTSATISIAAPQSSDPGAASAAINDIPLDAIRGDSNTTAGAPLGGIPLGGIPLGGIPLGGIPLGGIPLGGIGFSAANLSQNGLGGVPLSTIPLVPPDTWEAHLTLDQAFRGTPPQNVTLGQLLGPPVSPALNGVTLDKLNLASSPLGGIPLAGIALGSLPLGGIPLGGIANTPPDQNLSDWCAYVNQQPGFTCPNGQSLANQTMLGLALQGVPLGGIPLGGIPLGGIPLGGIPLGGIAVGTPLGGIPLGGINLQGTPLGGIPLGGIDMSGPNASPLGGITLGLIPASAKIAIFDCPTGTFVCADTDTLAQAKAAGAIKQTAKLEDLGYYKDAAGHDITLQDLVRGLPPNTTLEDLLATVLLRTAYDWEHLPLPGFPLQDFSTDGGTVPYSVSFTIGGSGAPVDGDVAVHLPSGARYVPNSTSLSGGDGTVGEPTLQEPENELHWHVSGVDLSTAYQLTFKAKPGLSLGTEDATAKISATGLDGTVLAPEPAATLINEPGEPANGQPATAQPAQPDTLYLGYTSSGSDRDFFQVHANAGEQLTIHLSHLSVDDDLVIYGPTMAPLRTPHAGAQTPTAGDIPFELGQRTQSITPEALNDVPQDALGQPVLDVSDNRGLADEEVSVVSPEGGTYTIQVTSFDGGYSNDPWMLRVEKASAIPLPSTCTNPQGPGTGVTKAMPAVPAGASTLYLFASKRFGDLYGLQAENDVFARLQTLAARTDAAGGAVIPVDANTAVLNAINARASDSCSPAKANDVVRALGNLLDNPLIVPPSVKYIVAVGDDAAGVALGRVPDNSAYANERGYASTFFGATNNQYLSTYGLGFLPTDDPLGDVNYSGTGPYVPELAVGRLVETPNQILSQITQYINRNGAINPTKALTTGYDFLSDGATRVSAGLRARVGANNAQELINNSWSKTNLLNAMFPAANPPILDSINAHYDHFRSLPADENAANRQTILFTTADLAGRSTSGRVIFTMGCHSALPVSNFVFGSGLNADWAEAYAQAGAIVYMGNTGFGLGDTAAVLYSEKLNALFAERLDGSMTVGQALAFAKQEYATTPTQSGYNLKVIDEATLMGLPMYRVGTGTAPAPPTPAITGTDSATGLPTAPFGVAPSFTRVNTAIGSYYVSDDAFAENRRPIEPTTKLDVTQPGLVAHGALLTALASTDETNFDAAFSRVVDDLSGFTPELVGDVSYPTKLQSIASLATPTGTRQRLTLFSGQFRSDGTPEAQGIGIQRRFTALSGNILYADASVTDFTPPTFGPVEATKTGNTVAFSVDVTDNVGGANGVKRVLVLYRDGSGTWKSIEMSHNSPRWSGAASVVGDSVEWIMQAVDRAGDVGVTSNKALLHSVVPPPPTGNIEAHATGPQTNGWFTDAVSVTISGAPDIEYSLDGGVFTPGTSLSVDGTGVHSLDFQGSDGSHGSLAVPIDESNPTVTVNATYGFGSTAHALCSDSGSGIASCTVPDPLDTSSAGTKTIHAHAVDRAGHTFDANLTYQVTPYVFSGFFSPIMNLPAMNDVNAGSSVPVKFGLSGFRGLNLFAQGYPASQPMTCAGVLTGPPVPTTPGGLSYDASLDRYTYIWRTANFTGCRQLIVRLQDGTEKRANFRFH